MPVPAPVLGVLAGIAAAAGFSLKAVLAKLVYRYDVDPTTLLAMRMAFAAPVYVVIGLRASRGGPKLPAPLLVKSAVVGILGYFLASYFDFEGLRHVSAGLERLVLYLYPTLVLAFGALVLGKRVRRAEVIGMVVAYLGLGIALSKDVSLGRDTTELATGCGFVFLSAVTYAAYVAFSGELVPAVGASRFTAIAMLAATVPMLLLFVATGGLGRLSSIPLPAVSLALVMAVFATVVPTLLMTVSIERLGSARAAIVGSVGPVLTIGLESSLLGERLSFRAFVGTVLVVAGVLGASVVLPRTSVVRDEPS